MDEKNLIDQIAAAVAARVAPAIPLHVDLWSAAEIAAYLKMTPRHILERYAPRPDFPKAIRLPAQSGGPGQPRWKASEVIAWAERHQEGAAVRGRARRVA